MSGHHPPRSSEGQAMQDARALARPEARDILSFGPFRLIAGERLLTRDGAPVELGARALDLLIALASRPNEVLGKRELLALVWPDVTVDEGSLRFHVAGLRKALGDGKDGARYIATLAGRGYCFVAPVSRPEAAPAVPVRVAVPFRGATFLPARLARMVGRDDGVALLSAQLAASRFVTIVGAGGVGKTTVAVAVAHALLEGFAGAVLFVDLGMLRDPGMVPASLASMLGIPVESDDPTPSLIAYLRDRHLLLILDNCEHLIEASASLAARIFLDAPRVHILATSREPLRVEGEHVHRLAPLGVPPEDAGLTASAALGFPAIELFVERAAASGAPLDLRDDADAVIVAHICRKLDGLALAIELAAGRVEAYGLRQTAALLDERLTLLWMGQRTAPPRQKTLQATLDWSHGLLSGPERVVLRRLAVFVGHFTLEAALAVVTSEAIDQLLVLGAIDSLVAKSMVAARPTGAVMRYRLLDTTRAYVLDLGMEGADFADLSARHAGYYRQWLESTGGEWPALSGTMERAPYLSAVGNVRAALEWCFGEGGDVATGIGLASAVAPVLVAMSLMTECHHWSSRAILALDEATSGGREEMLLQAAHGLSLMFTRGNGEAVRTALNRGLAIAEQRGDAFNQVQLLTMLHMYHHRVADVRSGLDCAKRSAAVSRTIGNTGAALLTHATLGISLVLSGHLAEARVALDAGLSGGPGGTYLGYDGRIMAGVALARTLYWQGHLAQAMERARRSIDEAAGVEHTVALSMALVWATSLSLAIGDLDRAEAYIDMFVSRAETYSLSPYLAVGRGFRGELAIRRGDARSGVEALQGALNELQATRYELLTTTFSLAIAEGLAAIGGATEGIAVIDGTIQGIEANGDYAYMAEAHRVKGRLLLAMPVPPGDEAEASFLQSLEWSRRQGALIWHLRAAVDLAVLWASQGRRGEARALLQPVFEQFVEGLDTADLREAARVLGSLGRINSTPGG
jgi:predicted ATPase/DNA-binding winged helix-turn-helix (wHTH) protein